jgi:hypothetical protein
VISVRHRRIVVAVVLTISSPAVLAEDGKPTVAAQRMEGMKSRVTGIRVSSSDAGVPKQLRPEPLFRYDDETRGYVDGTVWRLGETGRPLALITTELHPRYLNGGPVVVYDLLSLTDKRFRLQSEDLPGWTPIGSAVTMTLLPNGPVPANEPGKRLAQLKEQARRFTATQDVAEIDKQFVHLRMLPREIERYQPTAGERADGAIFLLVNGRNPAIILLIETDGKSWQ